MSQGHTTLTRLSPGTTSQCVPDGDWFCAKCVAAGKDKEKAEEDAKKPPPKKGKAAPKKKPSAGSDGDDGSGGDDDDADEDASEPESDDSEYTGGDEEDEEAYKPRGGRRSSRGGGGSAKKARERAECPATLLFCRASRQRASDVSAQSELRACIMMKLLLNHRPVPCLACSISSGDSQKVRCEAQARRKGSRRGSFRRRGRRQRQRVRGRRWRQPRGACGGGEGGC